MPLRSFLHSLLADIRGTAVIETAVILPVLVMLSLGFVDLTVGFQKKLSIQQYAQSGADLAVASFADPLTDSEIKTEIAALSGLPTTAITVTRWLECNNVKTLNTGCLNSAVQKSGYVRIDVTDTYEPILGDIGTDRFIGDVQLSGSVVVRTE